MDPGPRSEEDRHALIGQYESIRLDFKASALLNQPTDRVVKQLTEDVSAFANAEGGVIVIGLRESASGKRSVAAEVDEGVDPELSGSEKRPWHFALADSRFFPGQGLPFPGAGIVVEVPPGGPIPADVIEWTLCLDDAPSLTGSMELPSFLQLAA